MGTDLIFRSALNTAHPVNLIFGEDEAGSTDVLATVAITLAPPVAALAFSYADASAIVAITLASPTVAIACAYDNSVSRGPHSASSAVWQTAAALPRGVEVGFLQATKISPALVERWQAASLLAAPAAPGWSQGSRIARPSTVSPWRTARPESAATAGAWQDMQRVRPGARSNWANARSRPGGPMCGQWQEMGRLARQQLSGAWGEAAQKSSAMAWPWARARAIGPDLRGLWDEASRPPPGVSARPVIPGPIPPPPCYVPPHGLSVALPFRAPFDLSTYLLFVCLGATGPAASSTVPIRRVYMVTNTITLRRVVGDIQLPATSLTLALDADSWTWGFSASLPAYCLPDIEPIAGQPVELEASINGVLFRVIAEDYARERTFGNESLRVSGRGKGAALAAPYSPVNSYLNTEGRTAAQLMGDVLTENGVPLPWAVDWQLDDWLVPAGAFSLQGSYIDGLNAIVSSAGGYLQPHATDQTIYALPRYPSAPWAWGSVTPDFELPSAVTSQEGIQWQTKPIYNRVFVSGTGQGVLGQITRAGTAGDLVAPMVTDALITHGTAARQRGVRVLSDTGRQALVSLKLPLLPETGVIRPGEFVRYTDGPAVRMGLVRSTSVEASFSAVWQSITVETHL